MGMKRRAGVVDAGRMESPKEPVDREIQEEFQEAEREGSGSGELNRRLREYADDRNPNLTAGDVDAAWEEAGEIGDEAPSGSNPTPDQEVVDDIGSATGVSFQDNEPLEADKFDVRDENRWELDPASSEDYNERNRRHPEEGEQQARIRRRTRRSLRRRE